MIPLQAGSERAKIRLPGRSPLLSAPLAPTLSFLSRPSLAFCCLSQPPTRTSLTVDVNTGDSGYSFTPELRKLLVSFNIRTPLTHIPQHLLHISLTSDCLPIAIST